MKLKETREDKEKDSSKKWVMTVSILSFSLSIIFSFLTTSTLNYLPIPIAILILFLVVIMSNLKINIIDIAITFFGICYIPIFLMFIPIIRENDGYGKQ